MFICSCSYVYQYLRNSWNKSCILNSVACFQVVDLSPCTLHFSSFSSQVTAVIKVRLVQVESKPWLRHNRNTRTGGSITTE